MQQGGVSYSGTVPDKGKKSHSSANVAVADSPEHSSPIPTFLFSFFVFMYWSVIAFYRYSISRRRWRIFLVEKS